MMNNIKRILTMLEKAQNRLARQCYHDPKQYPKVFFEIEECINHIRLWINERNIFQSLEYFYVALATLIDELGRLISQLWEIWATDTSRDNSMNQHITAGHGFHVLARGNSVKCSTNHSKGSSNLLPNNRSAAVVPSDRFK